MDQVCGEVCTGCVRYGQPQYDQLPGGGRSKVITQKLMSLSKNVLVIFIRDLYIKTAFTQHIC